MARAGPLRRESRSAITSRTDGGTPGDIEFSTSLTKNGFPAVVACSRAELRPARRASCSTASGESGASCTRRTASAGSAPSTDATSGRSSISSLR